jgi:DNA gyrase subunit A
VVAATLVDATDEIMMITTGGVLIRTRVSEIREMGRATQGVTLIAVEQGETLSGLQRILEADAMKTAARKMTRADRQLSFRDELPRRAHDNDNKRQGRDER